MPAPSGSDPHAGLPREDRLLLRRLADRADVTDTVYRFARAMDDHDWPALRACLADAVSVDYSAFRGDAATTLSGDEFTRMRREALSPLRMQHVITNPLVTVDGGRAECRSCFVIHRVDPARPAREQWLDTAGHYVHGLVRTEGRWKIDRIVQTVVWTRGNREIHGGVRAKPSQ